MNIASYIDHTVLKPTTSLADIQKLCAEAIQMKFAAVCVPPYFVKGAKELLWGTEVKIATVIGFPFGYGTIGGKMAEIAQSIENGADELDVVHNIAAFKDSNFAYVEDEVKQCTDWAHNVTTFLNFSPKTIKVIIESGVLSDEEVIKCCELYAPLGIDFMKTSTGYADTGATVHAVQLMRQHLPETIQIKASGGIRTFAFAKELVEAGASRLGCSASMEIVRESGD